MLGLRVRRIIGDICINISIFSRVKEGFMLIMWEVSIPRCVVINMCREYRAVINMFSPVKIMVICDQENEDITTNNSPIKLMEGGRARLVRFATNHQKVISGSRL